MRLFGSDRIAGVMDRLGVKEGEVITHRLVTRAIENAQKRVEKYNFDIRKRLIEYDDVMNKQREVIYGRRDEIMEAGELKEIIEVDDRRRSGEQGRRVHRSEGAAGQLAARGAPRRSREHVSLFVPGAGRRREASDGGDRSSSIFETRAREALEARERFLAEELGNDDVVKEFEKYVLLQTIDEKWMDHLHELDYLKEGIHFRAYAQKDPLVEYKKEAFGLFADLNETIDKDALHAFFHAQDRAAAESDTRSVRARRPSTGRPGCTGWSTGVWARRRRPTRP